MRSPDVLVLGGGGILGEAWMSALLAGLQEGGDIDVRGCREYVGTSAGSIVAAGLAAGVDPSSRLGKLPEQPAGSNVATSSRSRVQQALAPVAWATGGVAAPVASLALSAAAGGGALVRRTVLRRVPHGRRPLTELRREVDRISGGWDGRLRVATVDASSGRRIVFGAPGAPPAGVGEAVEASCAIPGFFRPVRIGGRDYVDGGVWSPTNLDASSAGRGERVICLNPTAQLRSPLSVVSRSVANAEALAVRRRGASVRVINPDDAVVEAMGGNLMDGRRRADVIAAGVAQGRALAA